MRATNGRTYVAYLGAVGNREVTIPQSASLTAPLDAIKGSLRADEYPQGAGRICNAPSSRTAALGIGSYMVQWNNVRRAGEVLRPYMQNRLRGAKSPLDSGNSVCLF